ncbi:response regulator transcription factor [Nocardioides fonticola]|uniref:Response regulator transcription factor n=1 Tax=Nocardioides fonticola TaxID=450363 RepID=A0ABP7XHU8_9ACTN
MRILLVEDEPELARFVQDALEADGYCVVRCADGERALVIACVEEVDLVVLDLTLPGVDGLQVLERLRRRLPALPVIIVSARGQVEDKVRGLDLGADDYLVKPFALAELSARIRSALRAPDQARSHVLEVGGVSLDLRAHQVQRDGVQVHLTAREFQLLAHLMRHADQVISRHQLLQSVWDLSHDPGTKVVEVYIGQLRRKLGPDGAELIETVRQAGYRFRDAVPAVRG